MLSKIFYIFESLNKFTLKIFYNFIKIKKYLKS